MKHSLLVFGWVCFSCFCLVGCGDPDTSFLPESVGGTDPYCNDISDWGDEVTLTAVYTDPEEKSEIQVGVETSRDVVEMGAAVDVAGADVSLIVYDRPDLWLVLLPFPDTRTISVDGSVGCANRSTSYTLTLGLDPDDDDIATGIVFYDAGEDAGRPDGGNGDSDAD